MRLCFLRQRQEVTEMPVPPVRFPAALFQPLYETGVLKPNADAASQQAAAWNWYGFVPVTADGSASHFDSATQELRNERMGRMRVEVQSATPLPEDQRERLRRELKETFQREPLLSVRTDPELLGGLVVRVGDWLYDASVRVQLDSIRNQIIERSSHEIQSGRDRFSSADGN